MQTMRSLFAGLAIAASAAFSMGCSSQGNEYCDAKCDCQGCSDSNYDECVIEYDAEADIADAYDCSAKFDDRHDCIMSKFDCVANDIFDNGGLSCVDDYADLQQCESDTSARF